MIWDREQLYTKDSEVEQFKRQSDQHSIKSNDFRCQKHSQKQQKSSQPYTLLLSDHTQIRQNHIKKKQKDEIMKSNIQQITSSQNKYNDSSIYTYSLLGKRRKMRISFNSLKQKVDDALRREKTCKQASTEKQLSQGQIENDNEPNQIEGFAKNHFRYFDGIEKQSIIRNVIKCYRCGKQGHISKNCLQQKEIKCCYCLRHHSYLDCNSVSCFRCGQVGHMRQVCKAKGQKCLKCDKIGHSWRDCGSIILRGNQRKNKPQSLSQRQWEEMKEYEKEDLKNVICDWQNSPFTFHFNQKSKQPKHQTNKSSVNLNIACYSKEGKQFNCQY